MGTKTSADVVVIGGGAAGMIAAITAAEHGAAVLLLEPNERLGKKLNITGKGRCNLTNQTDLEGLLTNVPRNGRFLYSAFARFDSADTMSFFERLGVPLKVERGHRVFPVSDRAFDVSGALERRLHQLHVPIFRDRVTALQVKDNVLQGVTGTTRTYPARAAILATGGLSYPATGSTGDGLRLAASVGHTIVPPRGSLVPLEVPGCTPLQGLTLRNIHLTVREGGKRIYEDFGELLFTHFGVSGPLILSASAHMRRWDTRSYLLELDLKPALDESTLDHRLLSDFSQYANRDFCNALDSLLPQKLIPVIVAKSQIPPHQKVHDITKEQRRTLLTLLKHWTLNPTQPRPVEEAIVTSGGVSTAEINPKTMASKRIQNLYFAGELIDVDAYTGGFNLQIAWSTGYTAGLTAAQQVS